MVKVEGIDALARVWTAVGNVGSDLTTPGMIACLVDANGKPHARMQAMFYADGCKVNCARMDNAYDEMGWKSLKVTYNGQPVVVPASSHADGTYDFWRGCGMPTIRYGKQAQWDASKIRWDLLPSYTTDTQKPVTAKFDFTWNGLGVASMPGMASAGERADIGYICQFYMAFLLNPSDATWNLVRMAEDWSGNWSMVHVCEPATGGIIDYTKYGFATVMSPAQSGASHSKNPVAGYQGSYTGDTLTPTTSAWQNSKCLNAPNGAHLTSYGMLAGMITGAAHDLDNASFWANYTLLEINPDYTRSRGCMFGPQRRAAWCMRSLFIAAYVSSNTDYFLKETMRNIALMNSWITTKGNQWGIVDWAVVYPGVGSAIGYQGTSLWMKSYMSMAFDAIAAKIPEAVSIAQYLGLGEVTWHSKPYYMHRTGYVFICWDKQGKMLTSFDEMVRLSMITNGITDAAAAAIIAAPDAQTVWNLTAVDLATQKKPPLQGKCVNGVSDYWGSVTAEDSYPAGTIAAEVAAINAKTPGCEVLAAHLKGLPTWPSYLKDFANQKYHLKVRPR